MSQGTAPFMAIELLLRKSKLRHAAHHDLESLFFVLIYICTNLSGPDAVRTREELKVHSSIPLCEWFNVSASLRQIGTYKAGALCQFDESILKCFAPYFDDLKPCISKLFHAMYNGYPGTPSPISHDTMIKIFNQTLDELPSETISVPSASASSRVRKNSLGIHDRGLGPLQKKQRTLSRDAKPSYSNWTVISGDNAAAGGIGEGSRSRGTGSRKSHRSGRSDRSG